MKLDAYLNLDMVGRLRDQLMVQGLGSAKEWKGYLESLAIRSPIRLSMQEDPYLPTDAMAFYMNKIPSAAFFTGAHGEYHTPRDTADTLNYPGLLQVSSVVQETLSELVTAKLNPKYVHVEGSAKMRGSNRSFRIYLGTIPDYSQEGVNGVKISGTSKDSPAEKAGLIAGDVIVEVGKTKIENIYDYVYVLQSMKPNEPINMKVLRAGKEEDLKVVPSLKDG
jgi:membrane-associated protease RseP (regulator of RpoE activity)